MVVLWVSLDFSTAGSRIFSLCLILFLTSARTFSSKGLTFFIAALVWACWRGHSVTKSECMIRLKLWQSVLNGSSSTGQVFLSQVILCSVFPQHTDNDSVSKMDSKFAVINVIDVLKIFHLVMFSTFLLHSTHGTPINWRWNIHYKTRVFSFFFLS